MAQYVTVRREERLACVRLDRPEKRNALDQEMIDQLHAALDEIEGATDVEFVIFESGLDKAFVSGADIAQLRDRGAIASLARINARLFDRIESLPMPTLAAVRGFALGGGCEFALACDFRVAGRSSRFGQPEVSLGIMPAAGGTQRLPKIVGLGRAKDLVLTGRIIDAEEAERMGLVLEVVDDDDLDAAARHWAARVMANGSLAVRMAKMALNASFEGGAVGHQLESVGQAVLFESEDKHRRMTEFLERKKKR